MCRPPSLTSEAIKNEKVKALDAVRPVTLDGKTLNLVRAQYAAGVINDQKVQAYREEKGIKSDSNTETYTALKLYIDNERWFGMPFFIRAGKRMAKKSTIIHVQFKNLPALVTSNKCTPIPSNLLTIKIQPEESISIRMQTKVSGHSFDLMPADLTFFRSCDECLDAYTRLLLDALIGDNTLFIRFDEIYAAWKIVDPVIESFTKNNSPRLDYYSAGTSGPKRAELMMQATGYKWLPY
jgi:glucose-6-phosphate 1-dehydrogenase